MLTCIYIFFTLALCIDKSSDSCLVLTQNGILFFHSSYVEKFTDFLKLFVGIHLKRFESNPQFPVLEFLALLLKYTFRQVRSCLI